MNPAGRAPFSPKIALRGIAIGASFFALAALLLPVWRGYRAESSGLRPPRDEGLEDSGGVRVASRRVNIFGTLCRGNTNAAVLLVHGTAATHRSLEGERKLLCDAGFTVFSIDLPGHGRSQGPGTFGPHQAIAILDAAHYLAHLGGIDPARVGALGFSFGGYVLVHAAASKAVFRALVLAASPGNLALQTEHEYPGSLAHFGATLAQRQFGMNVHEKPAESLIDKLGETSLLFVRGSRDGVVPRDQLRRMFDQARGPRRWIEIEGAGHGGYLETPGSVYGKKLVSFFSETLLGDSRPSNLK